MWSRRTAERAMKSAWNIYEQTSNVDIHNLHNRKATLQFAVIDCASILLWYIFPYLPRMIRLLGR